MSAAMQHVRPFRILEGVDDMIVIVAVKLNVEYEAVGEPNPHPGNMGSVKCVTGEHSEGHCFTTLLLDLHNPAQALASWPPAPHH
jgi:hypothetical protein